MTVRLAPDRDTARRLVAVARRSQPADLVVSPGALLDVYSEEILEGWGVVVAGGRVAYIGPDAAQFEAASRIEGREHIVSPGLVEAHTHLLRLSLKNTLPLQVELGVTTTVFEAMELAFLLGPDAVRQLLADAAGLPGRAFFTVPPCVGFDPVHDHSLGPDQAWTELLELPGVAGVGECNWADVVRGHHRVEALMERALALGLTVEGHGAGLREPVLNAFAAPGVTADHEAIGPEDSLARLRLGLWSEVRQGATRQDLAAIAELWRGGGIADFGRLALVTDSLEAEELAEGRSLNQVVNLALKSGLALPRAVRLASRNPAERLGLGRWLGGLAPGMLADLVLLPRDGSSFRAELVMVGGARPREPESHAYPREMTDSLQLPELDPALLQHPGRGRWRAIEVTAPLVTREVESDGSDAIVVVAIDRRGRRRAFRGLLTAFGLRGGACAASAAWDTPCLVAAGDSAADLELAVRRLAEIRGGAVVVSRGAVKAEWRAELAGFLSLQPVDNVIREVRAVNAALAELGSPWPNPLLTIEALTTAVIPHLRLSAEGYVRVRDRTSFGLAWT